MMQTVLQKMQSVKVTLKVIQLISWVNLQIKKYARKDEKRLAVGYYQKYSECVALV